MAPDPTPQFGPYPPVPPEAEGPHVRTARPVTLAVVRDTVGMEELPPFFDRALHAVADVIARQGLPPQGPPVGVYYGMPGETVDVAVGFPVARAIIPEGDVRPAELPSGRVAELVHQGPYDSLAASYQKLEDWMRAEGHVAAGVVWETYLTMPAPGGDPGATLTQLSWLLVDQDPDA